MNEPETSAETPAPVYVPYQAFRAGLPAGRFRLIVNPERAQKYVRQRLFVVGVSLPMLGIGVALSLYGYSWIGLPLVLVGALLPRVIKAHAAKILLHLALHDDTIYHEALEYEILEVRYAT
jgi:hypothetical protein